MSDTTQFKVCAVCKNEIPINNFGLHEATCLRHHYQCKTCFEFIAKSGREDHDHLYHSMEKCEKCGTKFKPIDKEDHFSVCPNALLKCEFCDSDFIRSKFKEHKSACGARTERCENCDKYVMLRDMDCHVCNLAPQDFAVPVGTIIGSSSRPEVEITSRRRVQLSDYDVLPPPEQFFTPTDGTGSESQQRIQSLFSEKNLSEPKQTGNTRERNSYRDTIENTSDTFPIRTSAKPLVDGYRRLAEPKRQPMPAFDTSVFSAEPISSETFVPLSPLEDRLPLSSRVEYEPDPSGPCEFCGNQVPLSALEGHQQSCRHRNYDDRTETKFCVNCRTSVLEMEFMEHSRTCLPRNRNLLFDRSVGPQQTRELKLKPDKPESTSDLIPCQFCRKTFEFSEISSHQDNCNDFISPYQPFGEIGMKECCHCKEKFDTIELYTHQIDCLSEQQQIQQHLREIKQQQQDNLVEKSNCEFCDEEFRIEKLSQHSKICSENPENHCKHCLRYHSDPDHEKICSYRHFNSKDVHIPETKLPFASIKSDTIFENSGTINNKCPYCTYPFPALQLEDHKNRCAKNPKKSSFDTKLPFTATQGDTMFGRESSKLTNQICPYCSYSYPVSQMEEHRKQCDKNPRVYSSRHFDTKDVNITDTKLPFAATQGDTIFGQEKTNENCPYCTFPYPVLQLEEHRNQCAKNPRFRQRIRKPAQPVEMEPSPGGEMELKLSTARIGGLTPSMSDSTNKLREIYSQRDPSPHESKQQQVGRGVTRDDMYPNKQQQSHRRDSLSYYQEKYQQQNIRKQQQEPTKRTVTSPILRFEGTHQQYNTSKQQQQQAIKKTLSPPTIPYEGTHQQYNTSKQQQQQRATPSPTSLFRGREDSQFAFSNMTQNPTSNIPHDFKCEIKSIQVPTKRNPINKPTDLPIPNKHTNKFFPLTPTQDVPNFSNRFETSQRPNYDSMKIRYPPVSSSPNEIYPKIISSPTETTIDTSNPYSSTYKRNSVSSFQDKYKSPKTKVLREY